MTKIVYICSPFASNGVTGEVETNVDNAREYCRFADGEGVMPLASHLIYPQFMDDNDPEQRTRAMGYAFRLVSLCDELWVMGTYISEGMLSEMTYAHNHGIPVRFFDEGEEVMVR